MAVVLGHRRRSSCSCAPRRALDSGHRRRAGRCAAHDVAAAANTGDAAPLRSPPPAAVRRARPGRRLDRPRPRRDAPARAAPLLRRRTSCGGRRAGASFVGRPRRSATRARLLRDAGRPRRATASSWSAPTARAPRRRRSTPYGRLLLIGGPLALLLAVARRLRAGRRRAAAGRGDAPPRGGDLRRRPRRSACPLAAVDDEIRRLGATLNEMLARLEAALARERALRRRRQPRAAHAAGDPADRARAGAAPATATARSSGARSRSATEETDRLVALAEDLLVIARSDEDALPIRPEPVDVHDRAADASPAASPPAAAERAGRSSRRARPPSVAYADPDRLAQALDNLVDNALRHGDGRVRIERRAPTTTAVELHVRDEGAGFPPGFLPRAFERFARGRRRSRRRAPASGSPSWPRSPRRTAERPCRRTAGRRRGRVDRAALPGRGAFHRRFMKADHDGRRHDQEPLAHRAGRRPRPRPARPPRPLFRRQRGRAAVLHPRPRGGLPRTTTSSTASRRPSSASAA